MEIPYIKRSTLIAWMLSLVPAFIAMAIITAVVHDKKPREIVHVIHAASIEENITNYVTVTNVVTESKFSTKGCTFFMGPKRYYMIDSHGKEHDL